MGKTDLGFSYDYSILLLDYTKCVFWRLTIAFETNIGKQICEIDFI